MTNTTQIIEKYKLGWTSPEGSPPDDDDYPEDADRLARMLQAALEHLRRSCICAGHGICDPCETLAEIEQIASK